MLESREYNVLYCPLCLCWVRLLEWRFVWFLNNLRIQLYLIISYNPQSFLLLCCLQYLEWAHQWLIHAHHRSWILKFPTVVWCTEHCHKLPFCEKFISFFYNLVSSTNQINVVIVQELRYNIASKDKADSSFVLAPTWHAFLWVRPQQITKKTLIWDFDRSNNFEDLLKAFELRTKTSMHA